jgi:hypothetical protein
MTIEVWTAALVSARTGWQDQADGLDGPYRNLAQAQPELLGSRVGPAADVFLTTWEARVRALGGRATEHADALTAALYDFLNTDGESVQRTQDLLLWSDRDSLPGGGMPL